MSNHRPWLGLIALIPGLAMAFMDQTILPVALPSIQTQFQIGNSALQWALNSYMLATAILVLAGGKLCDRIGHRRSLIGGIIFFAFSSALCGISPNIEFLIGARALQGVGAALLFPVQTAFIAALFPPNERGKASGMMVSIGSLFLILGPLIGGYLTQMASWRWIFWINLPIAFLGCILARIYLPPSKPLKTKIDGRGFIYFAIFCSSLTLLFMEGQYWGWKSKAILFLYGLTLLSLFLLVRREKKAEHPFLDLHLLKHPVFASVNLSIAATQFILMITVFRAIYFQVVLGYTPSETGGITFISCLPVLFISPIGGFLSDKIGPKVPIAVGFLLLIGSFIWFGIYSVPSLASLLFASIAFGMGIPLIFTPSYSAGLSSIPPEKIGVGSGMIATFRTLSATSGVALIALVLEAIQDSRFLASPELPQLPPSQLLGISNGSLPIGRAPVSQEQQSALSTALMDARIAAFSEVHFLLGFLLVIALIAVLILHRRKSAHHLPTTPSEGWD